MNQRSKQYRPKRVKGNKKFSLFKKDKFYNSEWRAFTYRFLYHNPNCYACGAHKDDTRIDCDHLVPHKGDLDLFWKMDNLIPLCISCHSKVTQFFDKDFKEHDTQGKIVWLNEQRKKHDWTGQVKVLSRQRS